MPKAEARAVARVILDTVQAQDYLGGVFVNEKRVGLFPGAVSISPPRGWSFHWPFKTLTITIQDDKF